MPNRHRGNPNTTHLSPSPFTSASTLSTPSTRPSRRAESRSKTRIQKKKKSSNPSINKSHQRILSFCHKHFGFVANPKVSIRQNVRHIIKSTSSHLLPAPIENKTIYNLCLPSTKLPPDLLSILGLNLGFGISLPPKREVPINFDRLRQSIRTRFIHFDTPNDDFNPKLYVKNPPTNLPKTPPAIETAVDRFEESVSNFENLPKTFAMLANLKTLNFSTFH